VLLAVLGAWAGRLTFNWMRRWRGLGHEDWRYSDFRSRGPLVYWIVSFLGFHFFPTVLVYLGCLSMYPALASPGLPFRALDAAGALVCALAIWIESRADRELRDFHSTRRGPGEILVTGLWARSRHPNYFGEVLFWWGLYLFSLAANPAYWWAFIGPASITLLFVLVSVPMMERHMAAGHPGYVERQRRRSALIPWFHRSDV
jgi:steroid 5-alpha reductase family enzyme